MERKTLDIAEDKAYEFIHWNLDSSKATEELIN